MFASPWSRVDQHILSKLMFQRAVIADWVDAIEAIISTNAHACSWLVEFLSTDGLKYLKPYLLECPNRDVRANFSQILEKSFSNLVKHTGKFNIQKSSN